MGFAAAAASRGTRGSASTTHISGPGASPPYRYIWPYRGETVSPVNCCVCVYGFILSKVKNYIKSVKVYPLFALHRVTTLSMSINSDSSRGTNVAWRLGASLRCLGLHSLRVGRDVNEQLPNVTAREHLHHRGGKAADAALNLLSHEELSAEHEPQDVQHG